MNTKKNQRFSQDELSVSHLISLTNAYIDGLDAQKRVRDIEAARALKHLLSGIRKQ